MIYATFSEGTRRISHRWEAYSMATARRSTVSEEPEAKRLQNALVRANQQLSDSPWVSGVTGDCDQAHRTSGAVRVLIKRHSYSVTLADDISLISEQALAARADDTGTGAGFILPSPPKSGRRGSIVRVQVAGAQLVYRARRFSPYET